MEPGVITVVVRKSRFLLSRIVVSFLRRLQAKWWYDRRSISIQQQPTKMLICTLHRSCLASPFTCVRTSAASSFSRPYYVLDVLVLLINSYTSSIFNDPLSARFVVLGGRAAQRGACCCTGIMLQSPVGDSRADTLLKASEDRLQLKCTSRILDK